MPGDSNGEFVEVRQLDRESELEAVSGIQVVIARNGLGETGEEERTADGMSNVRK